MSDLHSLLKSLGGPPQTPALLASVVATQGSSYRKRGARLLILEDGSCHGLLSGGCLEQAVVERAAAVFVDGRWLRFQLDTRPFSGCDGSLDITVERVGSLLHDCWPILRQRAGGYYLNTRAGLTWLERQPDPAAWLSLPLLPLPRLLVVGGGPDSQALVALGQAVEWEVEWLCHPEHRHPVVGARAVAPCLLPEQCRPDDRSGAILVNHQLGRDAAYARWLWNTPLAYLGCVGSRARGEEILNSLWREGLEPERRPLYCPAGLRLGGEGPAAVALSVVAQMQEIFEAHA